MNTIEASNDPQRDTAQAKPADRPAPDAPPLRVYVKENNTYALQYETPDFQQAMKKAEQFQAKGQDILVNEKANPLAVHAKSNIHNDVDVGRKIEPIEKDGRYVRGTGETVLDSFYQKLPLNTEAFDRRVAKDAKSPDEPKAPAEAKDNDKSSAHAKSGVTLDKADPAKPAGPAVDASVVGSKADKPSPGAAEQGEPAAGKPVLKKTGYDLPEQILTSYMVRDGKYHDKESDTLRFQDHGKKLSTTVEDRATIADMVAIAAAKNWNQIELKGTDSFRQTAWLEAESRGLRTKGYEPTQHDLQQLEQLKRERGVAGDPAVSAGKADKDVKNTIEVKVDREINTPSTNSQVQSASRFPDLERVQEAAKQILTLGEGPQSAKIMNGLTPNQRAAVEVELDLAKARQAATREEILGTGTRSAGRLEAAEKADQRGTKSASANPASPNTAAEPTASRKDTPDQAQAKTDAPGEGKTPIVGRLLDHGRANYKHDPDEKQSYYVKLQTQAGERTVWGKDLERSMSDGKFKAGDGISLKLNDQQSVQVTANVRDGAGKVIGEQQVPAKRNEWEVKPAGLVVMRTLSPDEKVKVEAAFKVLDKQLSKYPEDLRREVLGRFNASVEKGDMKLPAPQVAEKSSPSRQARQPELERTR
ncbi:LPD7 domain-containing protein [Massilia putida]|uniref:LPD7 domain-containing protein n=1 Tax=Massilia putida TaxID=1141883 RepID=UPI0009530D95|nr:LPD7 domain-containing protein [Massilia putida]